MGKKVYGSGVMASDLAEDRPPSSNNMSVLAGHVGAPVADDTARTKAAWYLSRTGNGDLWEVLGLDDVVERRREVLGLAGPKTAVDPVCPVCGSVPGSSCKSERGRKRGDWHAARKRIAAREVSGE